MTRPRPPPRSAGAAWAVVGLLAGSSGAAGSPGAAQADAGGSAEAPPTLSVEQQAAEILRRSRDDGAAPAAEIARRIAVLGPAAIASGIELLVSRRVPAVREGDALQVLSRPQREILLAALSSMEPAAVRVALDVRLEAERSIATRAAALYVYGAIGGPRDAATVIQLAREEDGGEPDVRVVQALEGALTELVRRESKTLDRLMELRGALRPEILPTVLLAVGAAGDPRGVELLLELMRLRSNLVVPGASQIVRLGPSPSPEVNRELARLLIEELDPDDPRSCPTLALALGYLEEAEAVPVLIDLLESPSRGALENALCSLHRLSGAAFPATPRLWRSWYAAETRWYAEEAPDHFRDIDSPNDVRAAAAIRKLSQHRLHRHDLALRLAPAVENPETALRRLACQALGELGSTRGVEALVLALDDLDDGVRDAACAALKKITGLDHAADDKAWRDLVAAGM